METLTCRPLRSGLRVDVAALGIDLDRTDRTAFLDASYKTQKQPAHI
jgi:hypothetical protein